MVQTKKQKKIFKEKFATNKTVSDLKFQLLSGINNLKALLNEKREEPSAAKSRGSNYDGNIFYKFYFLLSLKRYKKNQNVLVR